MRGRKGLYNNNNNYNNSVSGSTTSEDMLLALSTQSGDDDSITSGSVTASTVSLRGQQHPEQHASLSTKATMVPQYQQQQQQYRVRQRELFVGQDEQQRTHYTSSPLMYDRGQPMRLPYPGGGAGAGAIRNNDALPLLLQPRATTRVLQVKPQAIGGSNELARADRRRTRRSYLRNRALPHYSEYSDDDVYEPSEQRKRDREQDVEEKGVKWFVAHRAAGRTLHKCRDFIIEYLQGASIHGFIYLAKIGLNFIERMLWFAFICVAIFAIKTLSLRTWERFQTSPMVISMDRNKLVWNTSFPSLTVCPHKRIDELKVDDYIDIHSDKFPTDQDKEDFRLFMEKLASLTYDNIDTLPMNKTFGITSDGYLDLIYELKWKFEPEMSSGATVQMHIYETLTEFGICHSVNSLVARYNSYEYWKNNDWSLLDHGSRVTVHPLDGEIYAQIINLSTAYDVYFHSGGDIPFISKQRYTFPESDYTTVELIALEIYTAEGARAFNTKQRRCRFEYEAENMLTVPIYSFGMCLAECRMFFALKVCGCVPHFYRNQLKTGKILPICDFKGLRCIATIKREIISLKSEKYKIDCKCLANCDDSNFFVQSYRSRVWFLGANLQWGIIEYPKMQLRRDVLFSFADVLVYIGGLVGFFLGCSALSFTELIYYFTARFIRKMSSG